MTLRNGPRHPAPHPRSRGPLLALALVFTCGCQSDLKTALGASGEQEREPPNLPTAPTAPVQPVGSMGDAGVEDAGTDSTPTPACPTGGCAIPDGGVDECPEDPEKVEAGLCGCGMPDDDADGDGTLDCEDGCPGDPEKLLPGLCGCGTSDEGREVEADCSDACPDDPLKWQPGACGCGVADVDTDGDGSLDCVDACPDDPDKTDTGACGCGKPDLDGDGDGTADCNDACPDDPDKTAAQVCGCGNPETDEDEDTVPDCVDGCVQGQASNGNDACGCGAGDDDSDGDGTADCADACADDPEKTEPGACGCNLPDVDTDADGVLDCDDGCPEDPAKLEPLACGCGVADGDSDGDATVDCEDECPNDPNKQAAGACGCGHSDTNGSDAVPDCLDLTGALVHRFEFAGNGTTARDSVGDADGTVVGTTLSGTGAVSCGTDAYVDLPNDLLASLDDVTLEAWLRRGAGNGSWQRVFDFGTSNLGEGQVGIGTSYVFLTPRSASAQGNAVRLAFRPAGAAIEEEVLITGTAALPLDAASHVVAVFDDGSDAMTLYVDGQLVDTTAWTGSLAQVEMQNNWLGRSQFQADAAFDGSIDEFRVYDRALDASQVEYSFDSGPSPSFLD